MLIIEGYASTERIDREGDIIKSAAFQETLGEYLKTGGVVLFNHDRSRVIGKALEAKTNPLGLFIKALIFSEDEDIVKAILNGALTSFSVGFIPREYESNEQGGQEYKKGDLLEVSVVAVPANPDAVFRIVNEEAVGATKDFENFQSMASLESLENSKESEASSAKIVFKEVGASAAVSENISQQLQKTKEVHNMESVDIKNGKKDLSEVLGLEKQTETVEVKAVEAKEVSQIEKAVNTLTGNPQFAMQTVPYILSDVPEGKFFYLPKWQITEANASSFSIPIIGRASIQKQEGGTVQDSALGTNSINLVLKEYHGQYPLTLLLSKVGGENLIQIIETNLKSSIGAEYDADAWAAMQTTPVNFDFTTKNIYDFYKAFMNAGGQYFTNPSGCAIVVNPLAMSWLGSQPEVFTNSNYADKATVTQGVITTVFGMPVFVAPVTEPKAKAVVLNRDYIASAQMGDVVYNKVMTPNGHTHIVAGALLGFAKAATGGIVTLAQP